MGLNFAAIDFETANHDRHSACAIGLAVVRGGQLVESRAHLIRPPSSDFHRACAGVHGLAWDDVRSAPTFRDLWASLRASIDGHVLLAHQAWFDRDVLSGCLKYYGIRYRLNPFADSLALAREAFGFKSNGLAVLCRRLKVRLRDHHDPGADAEAAARIAVLAAERVGVNTALQLAKKYGV